MAEYPQTAHEMARAGYTVVYTRPCSRCGAKVARYRTRNGKEITMDVADSDHARVEPHFGNCQDRRSNNKQVPNGDLMRLLDTRKGRALVLIDGKGEPVWMVHNSADADSTKSAIVRAAFEVQAHLEAQKGAAQ